ncbi:uncharacterized protein B0I36DRAFT_94460 [Microdochium trichocladiopsis]|uniref:GATA-type domain-containing protein n=1 Tax=Microdochium trichocladiopsis TaxID=1682393 RepID=A0A9P8YEN5_9PEZI|nr:uncharacterized protein B0I36DRAFT_94460 [Microdochium trichocladiopsis]KAH7035592.1 hypothetical protein B0I36DRAFT_94460 [Microdochium trichocladiopsis]
MAAAAHPAVNAPTTSTVANNAPQPTQPTCQNCSTSTTPLWRRDEMGNVLCNACGLFLKLHGRPRPISLKTDVIKSRNRVKTHRPDMQMKKKSLPASQTMNGLQSAENAQALALAAAQRAAQKTNGVDSPVSRTGTPSLYDPSLAGFSHDMSQFSADGLAQYPLPTGASHTDSLNGDHSQLDMPQTHEQMVAANASLKTRVSELEVINELYRGRLTQLEQDQQTADNFRHTAEVASKEAAQERANREEIQRQLEESHRRENMFKRRLDEMEQENQDLKTQLQELESGRHAKKARTDGIEEEALMQLTEDGPPAADLPLDPEVAAEDQLSLDPELKAEPVSVENVE